MKKLRFLVLLGLIMSALFLFCSCKDNKLATPEKVSVNIENELTWSAVDNARGYIVEITSDETEGKKLTPRKNTASLNDLKEGDYEIRVKAVGDGKTFEDSDWTETLFFHKNYETGCVYTLINNRTEYELTKFGKAPDTIYIEDEYRGKPVTRIAENAFKGYSKIINVYVGKNVKTIGKSAFQNCKNLKKVVLPDTLQSIGASAFQACMALSEITVTNITEVEGNVLPAGITRIEDNTFSYCRALTSMNIHENITEIGMLAFSDCSGLTSLTIPDSVQSIGGSAFTGNTSITTLKIGKGIKTIESQTFYMCSALKTIEFSTAGNLKTIGQNAFGECIVLERMDVPNGVEVIDDWAFCMEGKEVKDPDTNEITVYYDSLLAEVTIPDSVYRVGQDAFYGTKFYIEGLVNGDEFIFADDWLVACSPEVKLNLTKITASSLGDTIVGIADYAFYGCLKLEEISLPSTIKYIGEGAFSGNKSLFKFVVDNSSLERIGDKAFYNCEILNIFTPGAKLKYIGSEAFYACKALSNNELMKIPDSVESIGSNAFTGTKLWGSPDNYGVVYAGNWVVGYKGTPAGVKLEDNVKGIADYAFYNCATLTSVDGLGNVAHIGRGAFMNCERLDGVSIDSVVVIKEATFMGCTTLASIDLPRDLEKIERSAFNGCVQLKEINIGRTKVTEIPDYAFRGCTNLKTVNFGKNVTSIGDYAFLQCEALESVTLPNTVKKVGVSAFYQCKALKTVDLGDGVESIGQYAFAECDVLKGIVIPASVKHIQARAFLKCPELTYVTLEEGIETIGEYAFYKCGSIRTLILPNSLQSVGQYAFKGCASVTSLVLKGSLQEIGAHAFYGLKDATIYVESNEPLGQWHKYWNSMRRPVVYGCTLSDDKSYVVSVTVTETTFQINKKVPFTAPTRSGWLFLGWATEEGGDVVYTADQVHTAPIGMTLYARWSNTIE